MKNIKLAIVVGLLAGGWAYFALTVGKIGDITLYAWPVFLSWALFFAAGANLEAVKKVSISQVWGIAWGWLSVTIGIEVLGGTLGVPLGVGLAVMVLAALIVILMTDVKFLSFGPGAFAAWAVFFGTGFDTVSALLMLLVGVLFGYLSVTITGMISKKS
jgi:hypothetical protein